jgi:hypothetical protein
MGSKLESEETKRTIAKTLGDFYTESGQGRDEPPGQEPAQRKSVESPKDKKVEQKAESRDAQSDQESGLDLAKSIEDFFTPTPDSPKAQKAEEQPKSPKSPVLQLNSKEVEKDFVSPRSPKSPKQEMASPKSFKETASSPRSHKEPHGDASATKSPIPNPVSVQPIRQKLVEVQVPPGMPPGTTIYVELPGENRTLAAQVPPNVSSFHVAYTPRNVDPPRAPLPSPTPAPSEAVVQRSPGGREKLLSVRVPPGTPSGTTLHVSVPDEPGRILAAQVPPGNVRKFHVSYIPSERPPPMEGMLPPANAYRGGHSQGHNGSDHFGYHNEYHHGSDSEGLAYH